MARSGSRQAYVAPPECDDAPCAKVDVSISPWFADEPMSQQDAAALCGACHHIRACQSYAAKFPWADVVIGAWRAPVHPAYPPWAKHPDARPLVMVPLEQLSAVITRRRVEPAHHAASPAA